MEKYFILMDDEYKNKNYPEGFFGAIVKQHKSGGGAAFVVLGMFLLFFAPLTVLGIMLTVSCIRDGISPVAGIIITVIGLAFAALGIFLFRLLRKRSKLGIDDWIKRSSEASGYPENIIRDFDKQVTAHDTLILQLKGSLEAKNRIGTGTLTRDYILFTNLENRIIKRSDITAACLVDCSESIYVDNKPKKTIVRYVALYANGSVIKAQTKEEAGKKLISMLKEKNPAIDTKDGRILTDKEFDGYFTAAAG